MMQLPLKHVTVSCIYCLIKVLCLDRKWSLKDIQQACLNIDSILTSFLHMVINLCFCKWPTDAIYWASLSQVVSLVVILLFTIKAITIIIKRNNLNRLLKYLFLINISKLFFICDQENVAVLWNISSWHSA
jgi:hypothetical protein